MMLPSCWADTVVVPYSPPLLLADVDGDVPEVSNAWASS